MRTCCICNHFTASELELREVTPCLVLCRHALHLRRCCRSMLHAAATLGRVQKSIRVTGQSTVFPLQSGTAWNYLASLAPGN